MGSGDKANVKAAEESDAPSSAAGAGELSGTSDNTDVSFEFGCMFSSFTES